LQHLQLITFCGFGSRRSRPRRISKELASGHFHGSLSLWVLPDVTFTKSVLLYSNGWERHTKDLLEKTDKC
jgi:hypothetical protein